MGSADFVQFVVDQLAGLGAVESRRMFGGHGFYLEESFFAIAWKGRLFFKTDEVSREPYLAAGMEPFQPSKTQKLGKYFEVPLDVLEDPDELVRWARAAVAVSRQSRPADPKVRSANSAPTPRKT